MEFVKFDRVQEITATNGAGSLTLSGAVSKFRAFSAVMANADTAVCLIEHNTSTEWEVSLCTYASGSNTLTRSTVYASSAGGSLVNFPAGTKTITMVSHAAGTHIGFTSLTTLAASSSTNDDLFVVWDTSAALAKTMNRDELSASFKGGGNFSSNVALGLNALGLNTGGGSTVAIGQNALAANLTGANNTAVGNNTLSQATGSNNVALGRSAGSALTTGSNCIIIGLNADASAGNATNEITLGNSSIAVIRAQVTSITALSDQRDKKDIRPLDLGLDFLLSIEPKWFTWNMRPEKDAEGEVIVGKVDIVEAGFIAQQLQDAVALHPGAEDLGLVFDANPNRIEATPGKLIPVLVQAIRDLNAELVAMRARLAAAGL